MRVDYLVAVAMAEDDLPGDGLLVLSQMIYWSCGTDASPVQVAIVAFLCKIPRESDNGKPIKPDLLVSRGRSSHLEVTPDCDNDRQG